MPIGEDLLQRLVGLHVQVPGCGGPVDEVKVVRRWSGGGKADEGLGSSRAGRLTTAVIRLRIRRANRFFHFLPRPLLRHSHRSSRTSQLRLHLVERSRP